MFLPIHHKAASVNYPWLQHNVDSIAPTPHKFMTWSFNLWEINRHFIEEFVDSASSTFGSKGKRCIQTESDRIEMPFSPQSMQNYTASGFKKDQGTRIYLKLIKEFWDKNKDSDKPEQWESVTPTRKYFISVSG
jgi:hypothetical protein